MISLDNPSPSSLLRLVPKKISIFLQTKFEIHSCKNQSVVEFSCYTIQLLLKSNKIRTIYYIASLAVVMSSSHEVEWSIVMQVLKYNEQGMYYLLYHFRYKLYIFLLLFVLKIQDDNDLICSIDEWIVICHAAFLFTLWNAV